MIKFLYSQLNNHHQRQKYVRILSLFCRLLFIDSIKGRVDDTAIYVSSQDNWGLRKFYFQNNYNAHYRKLMRSILESNNLVFWDIGANYGAYALTLSQYATQSIAVEPGLSNFQNLSKSCQENSANVICEHSIVGDKSGEAFLYLSSEHFGDHRVYQPNEDRTRAKEAVKVKTIDEIASNHFEHMPKNSLIKIDVQGYESNVMRGAEKLIKNSSQVFILMEVWPKGLREAGSSLNELFEICDYLGLSTIKIFQAGVIESLYQLNVEKLSIIPWQSVVDDISKKYNKEENLVCDVLLVKDLISSSI